MDIHRLGEYAPFPLENDDFRVWCLVRRGHRIVSFCCGALAISQFLTVSQLQVVYGTISFA